MLRGQNYFIFRKCTFQLGENAVGLEGLEVEDLHVRQPEVVEDVEVDGGETGTVRGRGRILHSNVIQV